MHASPSAGRPNRPALIRALAASPSPFFFSYQQSPTPMVRVAATMGPQFSYSTAVAGSGLLSVDVDLEGRLRRFVAIPTQSVGLAASGVAPDWDAAFTAAGLDRARFMPAGAIHEVLADTTAAWTGRYPSSNEEPVRIEAAASTGRSHGSKCDSCGVVPPAASRHLRRQVLADPGSTSWSLSRSRSSLERGSTGDEAGSTPAAPGASGGTPPQRDA